MKKIRFAVLPIEDWFKGLPLKKEEVVKHLKSIGSVLGIAVLVISMTGTVTSYDNQFSRKTLHGFTGMTVVVEDLDSKIEELGLTRERIKTDVQLKLRLAGVRVLTQEDCFRTPGIPILYVIINTLVLSQIRYYVYSFQIEFWQQAVLTQSKLQATIISWSTSGTGLVNNIEAIRDNVKDGVDRFINAFLSVNPKQN